VPELECGRGHRGDPLGPVAPCRVHLKIAAVIPPGHHAGLRRRLERLRQDGVTEIAVAESPLCLNRGTLPGFCDGVLDSGRASSRDELGQDPLARGADEWDLAKRAGGNEIGHRHRQADDRLRRSFVAELAPFRRLQGGHVIQQRGGLQIDVRNFGGGLHRRVGRALLFVGSQGYTRVRRYAVPRLCEQRRQFPLLGFAAPALLNSHT
jgi:hypothetical protein